MTPCQEMNKKETEDKHYPVEVYKKLKDCARNHGLVLFVGAGVNCISEEDGNLIPTWSELLRKMLEHCCDRGLIDGIADNEEKTEFLKWAIDNKRVNEYEIAQLSKLLLGKRNLMVLREILYEKLYEEIWEKESPLKAIATLCCHPKITAVVTYNFDNLLEKKIKEVAKKTKEFNMTIRYAKEEITEAVGNPELGKIGKTLQIFHVHGYLPDAGRTPKPERSDVVFSMDEYYTNMLNPYSWQTSTQLHFLRNHNCLFLGVSLSDINMTRLLSYSNTGRGDGVTSFSIMASESFIKENEKIERAAIKAKATIFSELGLKLIISGERHRSSLELIQKLGRDLGSTQASS